jgi:N-acetylglucosaminyl-diphospho-decaprenol L-rhamnosyltransferase
VIYFITVNYYSAELIANLLKSIQAAGATDWKLLVVNNSPDDRLIHGEELDSALILDADRNLGFGAACNWGINWVYQQDSRSVVWIINPDTLVREDSLQKAQGFFETHPELSIVGTSVCTPNGKIWFAGGRFVPETGAMIGEDRLSDSPAVAWVRSDWVTGCSLLINLRNFDCCPQFDPDYFLYYEDFDFCLRYAKQGHLIGVTSQIGVVHYPSSIANRNLFTKFKYSTFGYLLAIERYAGKSAFIMRFIRLLGHALLLLCVRPQVGIGKLAGVAIYLKRVIRRC